MTYRGGSELLFRDVLVGRLHSADEDDGTWSALFEKVVDPTAGAVQNRVVQFIEFCIDWNGRVRANPAHQPSASEFNQFADVVRVGGWAVRFSDGTTMQIHEAPVFFQGGHVSWRLVET